MATKTKFDVKVGRTLNISHNGYLTTAMVTHVSRCQISVWFWGESGKECYRSFTTFGICKYLKEPETKILSYSL